MKKLSIIIPAYNVEKYLGAALESCVNQTLNNIEIIVVNDGSTDSTDLLIYDYMERYKQIKTIKTKNQGLSLARNQGLEIATGEYVYFLDGDDWIEENCMKVCCEKLDKYQLDFVTFDFIEETEKGTGKEGSFVKVKQRLDDRYIYSGEEFSHVYIKTGSSTPSVWKNVYRRDFINKNCVRFIPDIYFEDVVFNYESIKKAKRIGYIPKYFYHYRIRKNSIMTLPLTEKKWKDIFKISDYLMRELFEAKDVKPIWKMIVAKRLEELFGCNLFGVSVQEHKEEIVKEKERLLEYIEKYYCAPNASEDELRSASRLVEKIVQALDVKTKRMQFFLKGIQKRNQEKTRNLLQDLPFYKSGETIGIYGSGKNADELCYLYIKLVGEIKADIIYIDTYVESFSERHLGRDIININDIKKSDISEIVVFSYLYESEMENTVYSLYGSCYPIYKFYKNSIVSVEGTCFTHGILE